MEVKPRCQVLLLFAEQDSFDVEATTKKLSKTNRVSYMTYNSNHGFMDAYSVHYNEEQAKKGHAYIKEFLIRNSRI